MTDADEDTRADDAGRPDDTSRREHDLDEQEEESFPASDPHSDWSG